MKNMQVFFKVVFLTSAWLLGVSAWSAQDRPIDLPKKMRGINTPAERLSADLFSLLAKTDINVIRVGISIDPESTTPPTANNPLAPYMSTLAVLDKALPMAEKAGIKLIITAGNTFGYKPNYLWEDSELSQKARNHLSMFWNAMAKRYKSEQAIVAYDILNEPNYPEARSDLWYKELLPNAVQAIRIVNTTIWLIIEPGSWALPSGFKNLPLLNDRYVIYSFHHYAPHSYLGQGVLGYKGYSAVYPGSNSMWGPTDPKPPTYWDKDALRNSMQPVIDFTREHKVRILVGEFGVVRWAKGADKWLADSIALFEEQGWDWAFHSVGSWNGHSPTYAVDDESTSLKPDGGDRGARWQVMTKGWSLNVLDQNR